VAAQMFVEFTLDIGCFAEEFHLSVKGGPFLVTLTDLFLSRPGKKRGKKRSEGL
jgi:hypothetical protein